MLAGVVMMFGVHELEQDTRIEGSKATHYAASRMRDSRQWRCDVSFIVSGGKDRYYDEGRKQHFIRLE